MKAPERIEAACANLDRVLGFFPRAEGKASLIFAVDTAVLAVLALNLRPEDLPRWYIMVPAVVSAMLVFASIYCCYRCVFPSLDGGARSLIYFREIARRTEASFVQDFQGLTEAGYERDLLAQIWRNSEILKSKFDSVKWAFIFTALALVSWTLFLGAAAVTHAQVPLIH